MAWWVGILAVGFPMSRLIVQHIPLRKIMALDKLVRFTCALTIQVQADAVCVRVTRTSTNDVFARLSGMIWTHHSLTVTAMVSLCLFLGFVIFWQLATL